MSICNIFGHNVTINWVLQLISLYIQFIIWLIIIRDKIILLKTINFISLVWYSIIIAVDIFIIISCSNKNYLERKFHVDRQSYDLCNFLIAMIYALSIKTEETLLNRDLKLNAR